MIPQQPGLRALPPPTDAVVEDAVRDVFAADAKLAEALRAVDGGPSRLQSLAEWIGQTWHDLLEGFQRLQIESPILYWLVFAGLLVVLGLLLLHIGWTITRALSDARAPGPLTNGEQLERRRRHADWLATARQQAADGDIRSAVRTLVLSLLALLEERRVLHYASSWTTREILARLATRIGIRNAVATFQVGVERASYGPAEPQRAEYQRLEATMLELAEAAEQAAGDAP